MTLLIFFFLNFSSHLFHLCAWHLSYFSFFSSTVVSFQIWAWYLFPHCSYPSLFHWFNLFTIVCIYSLCSVLLLLALHNSVVSLSHFDAWHFSCISFLILHHSVSFLDLPIISCSSAYDRSVYLYINILSPISLQLHIYSLCMISLLYSFLNLLCFNP